MMIEEAEKEGRISSEKKTIEEITSGKNRKMVCGDKRYCCIIIMVSDSFSCSEQGEFEVFGKCCNCEINEAADNQRESDHLPQVRCCTQVHFTAAKGVPGIDIRDSRW
jgi:hypothetical protein